MKGNEQVKKAARAAAAKSTGGDYREISLAYSRRACTECTITGKQQWLKGMPGSEPAAEKDGNRTRCWQRLRESLKTGHVAIGTYLHRIGPRDTERCQECQAPRESIRHHLLEAETERKDVKVLQKTGVQLPSEEDSAEA